MTVSFVGHAIGEACVTPAGLVTIAEIVYLPSDPGGPKAGSLQLSAPTMFVMLLTVSGVTAHEPSERVAPVAPAYRISTVAPVVPLAPFSSTVTVELASSVVDVTEMSDAPNGNW